MKKKKMTSRENKEQNKETLGRFPKKILYNNSSRTVSREFDEFRVNIHLCKLRCWYS